MKKIILLAAATAFISGAVGAEEITGRKFEGVEFSNRLINHNETGYDNIPKQLAAEYGSGNADNLPLDPQLAELARLLVSVRDSCAYCAILHTKEAKSLGIPEAKINVLLGWRQSPLFTDVEAAALNYAEVISDQDAGQIKAAHEQLSEHLSQPQVETLLMVVANMNLWTRIFLAQDKQPMIAAEQKTGG